MTVDANTVKQRREAVRLDAWRAVFEKTDRIISERPIQVVMTPDHDIPVGMDKVAGWSDGERIFLNAPMVSDLFTTRDYTSAVLALKGLNYHELSHVLFTPRKGDEVPRQVIKKVTESGDQTWWYAFNALEDQRIETFFTSAFSPSRRYFEATILQWIIREGGTEAAILTHGRKYLSSKVRVSAARAFTKAYGDDLYKRFQEVINEYLTVVYPTDSAKAMSLVSRYYYLLKELRNHPSLPIPDNGVAQGVQNPRNYGGHRADDGCVQKGRVQVRVGREAREIAEEKIAEADAADAAEAAKQQQAREDAAAAAKAESDAQQGDQDGQGGDGADSAAGDADGAGDGAASGQEGDGSGGAGQDSSQDGEPSSDAGADGQAAGRGAGDQVDVDADPIRDLMDAAYDDLDEVRDDQKVQDDIKATLDAVKAIANDGQIDAQGVQMTHNNAVPATADVVMSARKVQHVLSRIRSDLEPTWVRRQQRGRLDIRRALSRKPNEIDIFTQWDEGSEDEGGVEAVILLDVSGSMVNRCVEASTALWALKRAFDKLKIRTTVLGFSDGHRVIYKPSDKVGSEIAVLSTQGGTNPASALGQAALVFGKSSQPNKVLITITDGQWGGLVESHKVVRTLHSMEVTTLLLGLDSAVNRFGKHEHKQGRDMRSIGELPKIATDLVAHLLEQHVHHNA